jgi:hypothetical protein
MENNFKQLTGFLIRVGVEQVPHTHKSYLAHLVALYRYLGSHRCPEEVCRAGMFHSIYGTERFHGFTLPLSRRDEIRQLIGKRGERLAYLNCALDRSFLDHSLQEPGCCTIRDRFTGQEIELSRRDFDDLCWIHLFDWLEQVPRSREWNYRRHAYGQMARRLAGTAQEEFQRVYAQADRDDGDIGRCSNA